MSGILLQPSCRLGFAAAASIGMVLTGLSLGFAQPLSDAEAVEAARESLDKSRQFPWYDAEADQVRRIDVEPPRDLKNRHSRWGQPPPPNWSWPQWLSTLLEVVAWTVLIGLLVVLVYALVRAFLSHEGVGSGGGTTSSVTQPAQADRVDSLPFQLARPKRNLLEEARRLYEEGHYAEAIVYLYSYQLVRLDQRQVIRLAQGKTNRQYLRELTRRPSLRGLLERTMVVFEDAFFGNHVIDRGRFEACWNQLDAFHREIEQANA